jgi:hypothetical protein
VQRTPLRGSAQSRSAMSLCFSAMSLCFLHRDAAKTAMTFTAATAANDDTTAVAVAVATMLSHRVLLTCCLYATKFCRWQNLKSIQILPTAEFVVGDML